MDNLVPTIQQQILNRALLLEDTDGPTVHDIPALELNRTQEYRNWRNCCRSDRNDDVVGSGLPTIDHHHPNEDVVDFVCLPCEEEVVIVDVDDDGWKRQVVGLYAAALSQSGDVDDDESIDTKY